jgi:hypothetical protein
MGWPCSQSEIRSSLASKWSGIADGNRAEIPVVLQRAIIDVNQLDIGARSGTRQPDPLRERESGECSRLYWTVR